MTASARPDVVPAEAVAWDGAVNARDLGGTGDDDRRVQPGRLYRMGRHEWITEVGWQQAWDDGVRTIIDLRNGSELGRRPEDPPVPQQALDRFTYVNAPTEDQSDEEFRALCGPYLSTPKYYRNNLERWPERFAGIARAVATAPAGGVVMHCAAGRDRTGMVTALLLGAAGISVAAISADYAAAVTTINNRYRSQEKPHEPPKNDDELAAWLRVARSHLEELLDTLDARQFLLDAGLTAAELALLTARLTERESPAGPRRRHP